LINELVDDFFSRERDRIELDLPDESLRAFVDEARITLCLKNLVGNALRYSSPEDGPVTIRARREGDELVLNVTDHGPGLPGDQAKRLGEPFYRSDKSRARESGGTGLGLYLASLVATAHGGSLELLNTPRVGADFEIRIPLIES
jgi:two-component system OmpR family sensor kinase